MKLFREIDPVIVSESIRIINSSLDAQLPLK
jgi:hypothetical protein